MPASVKLTGIVCLPAKTCALIEAVKSSPGRSGLPIAQMLCQGDRVDDLEVSDIDVQAKKVTVKMAGQITVLTLESTGPAPTLPKVTDLGPAHAAKPAVSCLHLREACLSLVLALYQELSGRTVLRPQSLPECRLDLRIDSELPVAEAIRALNAALTEKEISLEPYGDKLVLAVRTGERERLLASLPQPAPSPATTTGRTRADIKDDILPAGAIKFVGADLVQFLAIYQELSGRTLLQDPRLPPVKITVQTQTPLTRREALAMCDTLMALNNISMVPPGEKFVLVVSNGHLDKLSNLLTRLSAASIGRSAAMTPVSTSATAGESSIPAGAVSLNEAALPQVLELYQTLTRRRVEPAPNVPPIRFSVRNQGPLTAGELVYAFDVLLGLHNLALLSKGDNQFQLVPSAQFDKKPNSH